MQFDEYQERAMLNKKYGYGDRITYPTLGLASEAGEVAGKVKKILRDNGGNFTDENKKTIADEIGDVIWYCAALAEDIGWSLDAIAQLNIEKLESRRARGVISGSGDNR